MFRIDSAGATVDNRFTEGDPSLSIPATVVSDEWLNSIQEELIKPVEQMGLTLAKANEGQLWDSMLAFFLNGGRVAPFLADIANNTGPADVLDSNNGDAPLIVDRTLIKNKICLFDIERKTDTQIVKEYGILFLAYNSKDNAFESPKALSLNGDADLIFTLAQIGATDEFKLQATTGDLTGTSYVGTLDITSIIEIKQ
jgi:hypothetical protein